MISAVDMRLGVATSDEALQIVTERLGELLERWYGISPVLVMVNLSTMPMAIQLFENSPTPGCKEITLLRATRRVGTVFEGPHFVSGMVGITTRTLMRSVGRMTGLSATPELSGAAGGGKRGGAVRGLLRGCDTASFKARRFEYRAFSATRRRYFAHQALKIHGP